MKVSRISFGSALFNAALGVSFAVSFPSATSRAQNKTIVKTTSSKRGSTLEVAKYSLVPEATERCTQEESDWWERIRSASNDLLKKGDAKSKSRFALLLYEGLQKGYHVPLKDRPPQVLVRSRPPQADLIWKKKISGSIVLSIEYRADGTVGEVEIIKGVDSEMDNNVIRAAREALFLPAIKDRTFVTARQEAEVRFSTGRN